MQTIAIDGSGSAESRKAAERLADRPQLWSENEPYFEAFLSLSNTRPTGMGISAITFAEISAYLGLYRVPNPDDFVLRIRAADNAYLQFHAERAKRKHG